MVEVFNLHQAECRTESAAFLYHHYSPRGGIVAALQAVRFVQVAAAHPGKVREPKVLRRGVEQW